MSSSYSQCIWCPGCGHCTHAHVFSVSPYTLESNLGCDLCAVPCPADEIPVVRQMMLANMHALSVGMSISRGI